MKILVKQLHGSDHPIEISPDITTVQMVKEDLQRIVDLPVSMQRLMFKGKTLSNEKFIKEYGIEEGSKIHLFKITETEASQTTLWSDLSAFLRSYYNETERKQIIDYMKKDISEYVERLSLDDIERIAKKKIDPQSDNEEKTISTN
ncbi:ubiquitin-like protein 4A [Brevipalpus obovatus]|uniref:ubiquitin-like protein 4A n=1 Tax=Brevipalpus obovatus TaxID=246614 RepID=UPI003D9F0BB5